MEFTLLPFQLLAGWIYLREKFTEGFLWIALIIVLKTKDWLFMPGF